MQQLLAPAVFLTATRRIQSQSLNARNFLISEPVLWLFVLICLFFFFFRIKKMVQRFSASDLNVVVGLSLPSLAK